MRRYALAIAVLLFAGALTEPAGADEPRVFACNYTVSLTVDDERFIVTQQSQVRDGSHIPIESRDIQLQMRFSAAGNDKVLVELVLLEPTDTGWTEIYPKPLAFEATYGEPVEFSYTDDIAEIEIAMIVSETAS